MKITKKILTATAALMFASSFIFAQESEQPSPVSEAYVEKASETAQAATTGADTYEEATASEGADTYEEAAASEGADTYEEAAAPVSNDTAKKSNTKNKNTVKNPFEGMFTPKQDKYIFYGEIPLSTGTIGYGIKHRTAQVFVDPQSKKVGIQTYYQSSFFDFMFDEKDVALIAEGFEKYLEDFANHKLIKNKSMKTRKIYTSKGKCRVEWGTVKFMMNNFGDAKFHVGYEFKNKAPYFCIIVKDAKNIATDIGSNHADKSVEVQLYFTKAEARKLLDMIGRERVKQELAQEALTNDEY